MENQIPQQPAQQPAAPQQPAPQPRPQQMPPRPPMPPRPQQPMMGQPMMGQPMYQQPMYQQPMMGQPYGYGMPPQAPVAPAAPAQNVIDPAAESHFTGGVLGLIGISILQGLLMIFTLFIGTPWAYCMKQRWLAKHTYINGQKLIFDGTGGSLFVKYIIWSLLTLITFSIYSLWIPVKFEQWRVSHLHIDA